MVECQLPKLDVAGSSPVARSTHTRRRVERTPMRAKVKCPTCRKEAPWAGNPHRPFCSPRCRLIDLGSWAEERYRIAGEGAEPPPGEAAPREATRADSDSKSRRRPDSNR